MNEQDAVRAREEHYHEVSLRAVELLARAQRTADEAVAEAQSYARDLEHSAREQYQQILLRAQAAAQQVASAEGSARNGAAGEEAGALDAEKLTYVRTYARVAHAQLKSVLAALNDELDQLAAMAEEAPAAPRRPGPHVPAPPAHDPAPYDAGRYDADPHDPLTAPWPLVTHQTPPAPGGPSGPPGFTDSLPWAHDHDEQPAPRNGHAPGGTTPSTDPTAWPPIFAATNEISYFPRG